MNPDPIEKIFKPAAKITLDRKKKDLIHQEVLQFMKRNPFIEGDVKKGWFSFSVPNFSNFRLRTPAVVLASIVLFLLVGGVVSVKADTALPGDLLYPIKIGFNEKIEEALAFSDKAKLNLNIKLAELRLQEAEQLAVRGKLNSSNEAQINSNFNDHASQASEQLNRQEGNQEVQSSAVNFKASLKADSIVINGLQQDNKNNIANALVGNIENVASKISDTGLGINNNDHSNIGASDSKNSPKFNEKGNIATNISAKISAAENSVNTIQKLIQNNKARLGSQAVLQSEANLNLAQQKIDEGTTQAGSNSYDYGALASALNQASVITQETKDLIDAKTNLGINIPINIPLEADTGSGNNQNTNSNHDKQKNQSSYKGPASDVNIKSDTNINVNTIINTNTSTNAGTHSDTTSSTNTNAGTNVNTGTESNSNANANVNTGASTTTNTGGSTNTNITTNTENSLNGALNNLLK